MQKVLILGYKGTLGQALMAEFNLPDYEVVGWDREEADIISPDIKNKIVGLKPDVIINATGYNAVDKCEVDSIEKDLAYKINSEAPKQLAEVAKKIDAVFVNYSSDYVFKGDKKDGYTENDVPNPVSVYGESKLLGEKNIQSIGGRFYIIRPSRIFGKPGISTMSKKSFVDIMVEKKNEAEIRVVDEEKGSPTYAPDLARFTRMLIEGERPHGIYHGTNSGACTWYEWAEEIFKILNSHPKLVSVSGNEFPRPARRPMYSALINTKMPPQRSWQEALKEYLKTIPV
jgi:dTDP-4-dehydrorhamnose reductase